MTFKFKWKVGRLYLSITTVGARQHQSATRSQIESCQGRRDMMDPLWQNIRWGLAGVGVPPGTMVVRSVRKVGYDAVHHCQVWTRRCLEKKKVWTRRRKLSVGSLGEDGKSWLSVHICPSYLGFKLYTHLFISLINKYPNFIIPVESRAHHKIYRPSLS